MANQLYGYTPSYATAMPSASATSYGAATSRALSLADRYLTSSDPLKSSSAYLTASDLYSYTSATHASLLLPPGFDVTSTLAAEPLLPTGIKRSSEALYYPTVMASHNVIGQSEDWYSTSPLVKHLKLESASNLSIYPQRPGEKDCAHFMLTRTCKFGDSCKFDHPSWVPEGGIPDWKEVPAAAIGESLPERPGEPDCPYFLKTQRCKFGSKCKFNHPKDQVATLGGNADVLPERPFELACAFYMKTGKCKFGANCKFHHPKDIQIPTVASQISTSEHTESVANIGGATADVKPVLYHNSKGLPVRLGEVDCPFYLKTGSCKYGASCRYNHPDRTAFNSLAAVVNPIIASPLTTLNIGVAHPATSFYQTIDPRLAQSTVIPTLQLGATASVYPQRPGQTECDYYMKTGVCKFGERCKFHHPGDRSAPIAKQASQTAVKLTHAGLPRREGAVHCPYYMKTGTCKYGATCKFDHPPPGEAVAMAATQGASAAIGRESKFEGNGAVDAKA